MDYNKVVTVDEEDRVIGHLDKMEAHRKGVLHRAISALVFNSKGEWLLQQRAKHKYHSSLLWSNTTCTHPLIGESYLDAANRRLNEEMGMFASLEEVFDFTYKTKLDNDLFEHELDHVFIGYTDVSPNINPEEVESFRYISTSDLANEIESHPERFTVWFKILFNKIMMEKLI